MYHNIPLTSKEAKLATIMRRKFSQTTLFVIQLSGSKLASSKPCKVCHHMMCVLHVKTVVYTDTNGNLREEKVKNLETNHISQLSRVMKKN